jgi:type III secretion system YscD/HrpQ family protein
MQLQNKSKPALTLRVVRGVHSGAERRCHYRDLVVIGSADECDVILSDPRVAASHCILSVIGAELSVRPIAAGVTIDNRELEPGNPVRVDPFQVIGIGDSAFALGPAWNASAWQKLDERLRSEAANNEDMPRSNPRRRWRIAGVAAAGALVTAAFAISAHVRAPTVTPPTPQEQVQTAVKDVGLANVEVHPDVAGVPHVSGFVAKADQVDALRAELARRNVHAVVDVRSGADMAKDVQEILRLSGIDADSRNLDKGTVEVRGHFGDQKNLRVALESRAMHDIEALKKVVAVNLDPSPETPKPQPNDGKRIAQVVEGTDPYLVTRDGSRYYVGAVLPNGAHLQSVEGQQAVVATSSGVKRLARLDDVSGG